MNSQAVPLQQKATSVTRAVMSGLAAAEDGVGPYEVSGLYEALPKPVLEETTWQKEADKKKKKKKKKKQAEQEGAVVLAYETLHGPDEVQGQGPLFEFNGVAASGFGAMPPRRRGAIQSGYDAPPPPTCAKKKVVC
jgi:hypothetical protein